MTVLYSRMPRVDPRAAYCSVRKLTPVLGLILFLIIFITIVHGKPEFRGAWQGLKLIRALQGPGPERRTRLCRVSGTAG